MPIIDHGIWNRYSPDNAETISGKSVLYLRNSEGIDLYDFFKTLAPGTFLAEVFADTGNVLGFTGMDGEAIDPTTRFPDGRRLLEINPPRMDLKGMRWDGSDFVPIPPAILTRTAKADVWRRLTDEEAEVLDAALLAAPLRLRRIFEAAQYLDTADADYPALRAGIVAALGETRANEVLTPTY